MAKVLSEGRTQPQGDQANVKSIRDEADAHARPPV
jgi:hypothetical protein